MNRQTGGFTLVEIAIVITVIGLIVGGVTLGQSLIRGSKINSIGADTGRVRQAVKLFRDKYRALPGDMPNATTIWGSISVGCTESSSTTTATCNGNGDGYVTANGGFSPLSSTAYETLRAWQHLSNAGMIDGSYTGGTTVAGQYVAGRVGVNLPAVAFEEATMDITGLATSASTHWYGSDMGNYIMYGKYTINGAGSTGYPYSGFLIPSEAESVDLKLDDGKPGTGRVRGWKKTGVSPNCTTSDVQDTADYDVTSNVRYCALLFRLEDSSE